MDVRENVVSVPKSDVQKWIGKITWLQQRIREIKILYPEVEKGRHVNEESITEIQDVFTQISQIIIKDYHENHELLGLIHTENKALLNKTDAATGKAITFSSEDKQKKDQLSTAMNKEIFIKMVEYLETIYEAKQHNYCSGYFNLHKKSADDYVSYLNSHLKEHQLARMVGVTLADIYHALPILDKNKLPVKNIKTLASYKFSSILSTESDYKDVTR